jgi:hypothetical protein
MPGRPERRVEVAEAEPREARRELGLHVGDTREAEQVDRGVAPREHHPAQALLDLRHAVAARPVVGGVEVRARRVQARAHRVEPGVEEPRDGVGQARVRVEVQRPALGPGADAPHGLDQQIGEEERLALAALAKAHDAAGKPGEVGECQVGDLARRGRDRQAVVARAEGPVGLERDAADALRVAGDAGRKRRLVAAEEEVLRGAAAVLEGTALELARHPVARELAARGRDPGADARERKAPRVLARVGVAAEAARKVPPVGEADRAVGVGREHGGAPARAPGGVVAGGVGGRQEGGDRARLAARDARDDPAAARLRRDPDGSPPRHCEEVAPARERDPLGGFDRLGPGAPLAGCEQARVVEDPPLGVAHEQAHGLGGDRAGGRHPRFLPKPARPRSARLPDELRSPAR